MAIIHVITRCCSLFGTRGMVIPHVATLSSFQSTIYIPPAVRAFLFILRIISSFKITNVTAMRPSFLRFFPLLSAILCTTPSVVTACEGECIVGIANAFLTNYTVTVHAVLSDIVSFLPLDSCYGVNAPFQADDIVAQLIPNRRYNSPPLSILQPIYSAYKQQAYTHLETDIFPSYFHGKCAQNDSGNPDAPAEDPPGCPNPDCPVVCGTPGSLVHFYPKLRYIAFDSTRKVLKSCAEGAGEEVKRNVQREIEAGGGGTKRRSDQVGLHHSKSSRGAKYRRATDHAMQTVERLIGEIPSRMEIACGGTGTGTTNGLPDCSWEAAMKEYILSFP